MQPNIMWLGFQVVLHWKFLKVQVSGKYMIVYGNEITSDTTTGIPSSIILQILFAKTFTIL